MASVIFDDEVLYLVMLDGDSCFSAQCFHDGRHECHSSIVFCIP